MMGAMRLALGLFLALVAACLVHATSAAGDFDTRSARHPMLSIVETDNGRTANVRLGGLVQITLPENATTGYRWAIERYSEECIEAVASEPHYPANAIGSGGEVAFLFRARKVGMGEISLRRWRHWEGDSSITARFRLRLAVQP